MNSWHRIFWKAHRNLAHYNDFHFLDELNLTEKMNVRFQFGIGFNYYLRHKKLFLVLKYRWKINQMDLENENTYRRLHIFILKRQILQFNNFEKRWEKHSFSISIS